MKCPIIVLVDTDEDYVVSLALRFATTYGNTIDLRVITDAAYYKTMFQERQHADVLLISDTLWSEQLKNHDIQKILVINDQNRFNNLKSIVSKAMEGISDTDKESQGRHRTSVIGLLSASGGAGTTSISLALAGFFAKNHKQVLYLNLESIQCFSSKMEDKSCLDLEACQVLQQGGSDVYRQLIHWMRTDKFTYLPALPYSPNTLGLSTRTYLNLIEEAKDSADYDFIVLNMENGFSEQSSSILGKCDTIVVLTMQDITSVSKTNYLINNLDMSTSKYVMICNQYDPGSSNHLLQNIEGKLSVSGYIRKLNSYDVDSFAEEEGLADLGYRFL